MIDFRTRHRAQFLMSRLGGISLVFAASVGACVLAASELYANGWDEFQTRCVNPAEAGKQVDTSGLVAFDRNEVPFDAETGHFQNEPLLIVVQNTNDSGRLVNCVVYFDSDLEAARSEFDDWLRVGLEQDAYQPAPLPVRAAMGAMDGQVLFPSGSSELNYMVMWKETVQDEGKETEKPAIFLAAQFVAKGENK